GPASTKATLSPALASAYAAMPPPGPLPTTQTSNVFSAMSSLSANEQKRLDRVKKRFEHIDSGSGWCFDIVTRRMRSERYGTEAISNHCYGELSPASTAWKHTEKANTLS